MLDIGEVLIVFQTSAACSSSAEVKAAATAQVQRLKRNEGKGKFLENVMVIFTPKNLKSYSTTGRDWPITIVDSMSYGLLKLR